MILIRGWGRRRHMRFATYLSGAERTLLVVVSACRGLGAGELVTVVSWSANVAAVPLDLQGHLTNLGAR